MGSVAIFSSKKPEIGRVIPDASLTENHSVEVDVSAEPIEDGSTATDHIQVQQRQLTLTVGVTTHTDTLIPNISSVRHITLYRDLQQMAKTGEIFTAVTSLERYSNCVLTLVGTQRSAENTNALEIVCAIIQLETSIVDDIANLSALALDAALPQESLGSQGVL